MKIKHRPEDFIVLERVATVDPAGSGEYGVYRMTKRKLTTFEAVGRLARAFRIPKHDFRFAGLKDRQSLSEQVLSIRGAKREYAEEDLALEYLGRAEHPVTSESNEANQFEIVVRDCREVDLRHLERNLAQVQEFGLPNYFDDQRFSCVRYGQGFIARDLIAGKFESAFRRLTATIYDNDDETLRHLKALIRRKWGQWDELADALGERQMFRSAIEYLAEQRKDFIGALNRLGTGLKTIHLFAYQSYIWNWTVHRYIRKNIELRNLTELPFAIARHVVWRQLDPLLKERWIDDAMSVPLIDHETRIDDGRLAKALRESLEHENLTLSGFRIPAETIFFKEEPRPLVLLPENLSVQGPEPDEVNRGRKKVTFTFTLPRGSYGTLVVRRLFLDSPNVRDLTAPVSEAARRGTGPGIRGGTGGPGGGERDGAPRRGRPGADGGRPPHREDRGARPSRRDERSGSPQARRAAAGGPRPPAGRPAPHGARPKGPRPQGPRPFSGSRPAGPGRPRPAKGGEGSEAGGDHVPSFRAPTPGGPPHAKRRAPGNDRGSGRGERGNGSGDGAGGRGSREGGRQGQPRRSQQPTKGYKPRQGPGGGGRGSTSGGGGRGSGSGGGSRSSSPRAGGPPRSGGPDGRRPRKPGPRPNHRRSSPGGGNGGKRPRGNGSA